MCIYMAVVLQIFLVCERVLHHMLALALMPKMSPLKAFSSRGVLAALFASVSEVVGVGIGVFLTLGNVLLRNIGQIAALTLVAAGIIVLAGDGKDLLALFINTYNSGIGVLLNVAIVQSLRFVYLIATPFIVLYNGVTWFSGQLVVQVVLPMLQVNVNALPDLMEGIMKTSAALALSLTTLLQRLIECSAMPGTLAQTTGATPTNYTVPFTDVSMHCVANDNYLTLDLMTPGAFFRQAAEALLLILTGSCSALTPILEVVWYPPLDYNLYWALHNAVNFVLELLVLPLKTWRMCAYGGDLARGYTAVERSVMCTPDFVHANGLLTRSFMAVGKLFDNWLDVALHVAETQTLGVILNTSKCTSPAPISSMRADITALGEIDGSNGKATRVVGLEGLMALTDGVSSTLFDGQQQLSAIEHWPVEIDASLGVAAVHFYGDDQRTAMLGCACKDEAAGMRLLCASTPLTSDELNRTVHAVTFDASDMTCGNTRISIQALRFPRSRFSTAITRGTDAAQTERVFEDAQEITDVADAIIVIQPRCSLAGPTRMACVPGARNCFPYCMGVHVAGRRNHIIRLENARVWRESVQYRETDCAVTTQTPSDEASCERSASGASGVFVAGPDTFTGPEALFTYSSNCVFDARNCVEEPQATSSVPSASVDRNEYNAPVVQVDEQPLVVAGDVMLFKQSNGLVVSRLRNTARGMRQERLTTHENSKLISYQICDSDSVDEQTSHDMEQNCAGTALQAGKVLLPFRVEIDNAPRPAVASRWAVHWAVNAELSVLETLFAQCQGSTATGFIVLSSVRRPRVWTVKTTRATFAMGVQIPDDPEADPGVSYFVLPNAVNDGTACHAIVNMEVDSMEFIDDANILVTTKLSSPAQWPDNYEYEYYYLHPNRHDCYGDEGDLPIFSCWRRASEGPFSIDTGQAPLMAGQLCPALERMPKLGSAGGHLYSASAHMLRLIMQIALVIPALIAANGNVAEIFEARTKLTYHSTLDSSGNELLDFDSILIHMDRSAMYTWQTLNVVSNLFRGAPGHAVMEGVLVGTAKVKQFAWNEPAQFNDPLLRKLQQITAAPTGKLLQAVQKIVIPNPLAQSGIKMPAFVGVIQGMAMQVMSSFKLNVRILRRYIKILLLRLRPYSKYVDSFQFRLVGVDIVGKFSDDLRDEALLSLTDQMRTQCDGFSTMLGFDNPFARIVRHACMLIPLNIDALLEVMSIMFSAYPTVSCVCKLSETDTEAWRTTCRERVNALTAQAWTKGIAVDLSTQQTQCFAAMDVANKRLETAFDRVYARMQLLAESLSPALDYLTVAWDVDAGQCVEQGGFVVNIMPDPVDYFMSCSGTYDCRARCLENFVAFENALAQVETSPQFEEKQQLRVESKFFSSTAIDEGLHLPPFDIRAVFSAQKNGNAENNACGHRVLIAGISAQQVVTQRYCVPRDITAFVSAHDDAITYSSTNQKIAGFSVQDMQILQVEWEHAVNDQILLLVAKTEAGTMHQKLLLCSAKMTQTILQTTEWDPQQYDHDAVPGSTTFTLQGIVRIRVLPKPNAMKFIFVIATRMVSDTGDTLFDDTGLQFKSDYYLQTICIRLTLPENPETSDATWDICPQVIDATQYSADYAASHEIVPNNAAVVCHDHTCAREILLPRRKLDALYVRTVNYDTDMSIFEVQKLPSKRALASMLGLQVSMPLYLTQDNAAAPNIRHVSPVALDIQDNQLHVLVTGLPTASRSNAEVWLQMASVGLDTQNMNTAALRSSENFSIELDISIECTLDNCVGCQTNPPREAYINVHAKCLAAQQCALAKCVATPVNLARPLCNIGAAMTTGVDLMRVGLHGTWVTLSRQIILIVELSESRRQEYEVAWPEQVFMSTICATKDAFVETMATFTAIVGRSALVVDTALETVQVRTAMSDSRWRARFFMALEAITRLLSAIAMLPLYAAIAVQRTMTCLGNDVIMIFQNAIASEGTPRIRLGSKQLQEQISTRSGDNIDVGVCLSTLIGDRMRSLGTQTDFSNSEIGAFVRESGDLMRRMPYEVISQFIDAILSYNIGIVNGIMDVAQTIDFERCKLPDMSLHRTDQCVCGDTPMRISAAKRLDSALWCTGPILLTNTLGQDSLVWNPYTFAQLIQAEHQYDDYITCLAANSCTTYSSQFIWEMGNLRAEVQRGMTLSEAQNRVLMIFEAYDSADTRNLDTNAVIKCFIGCEFFKPSLPLLEQQGVENMQMITRCRGNYQAKQWDPGAALLGVYNYNEWQEFLAGSVVAKAPDSFGNTRATFRALQSLIVQSGIQGNERAIACLVDRLGQQHANHLCMYTTVTNLPAYFVYEIIPTTTTNADTQLPYHLIDACESFTGVSAVSNNATLPLFVWSGSSDNNEPVASEHYKHGDDNNLATAQFLLDKLVTDVRKEVEILSAQDFDSSMVEVGSFLVDGDVLHQLVDCIIIGPYAAADMRMQIIPESLSSVMQYHRGSATSREFLGGSNVRQNIMQSVVEHVSATVTTTTVQKALEHRNSLISQWQNEDYLGCICLQGDEFQKPSLQCCAQYSSVTDMKFYAQESGSFDLSDGVLDAIIAQITDLTHTTILSRDIWQNNDFTPEPVKLREEEKYRLRNVGIFHSYDTVRSYDIDEVVNNTGYLSFNALWKHCMSLLDGGFFTMPMRGNAPSDSSITDDIYAFNPALDSSDAWLHAQEGIIAKILNSSRSVVPVFWTHQHRYIPSDSVWCEDTTTSTIADSRTPADISTDTDLPIAGLQDLFLAQTVLAPKLNEVEFPARTQWCVCGLLHDSGCSLPTLPRDIDTLAPDLLQRWQSIYDQTYYNSRAELFTVLEVMQSNDDAGIYADCYAPSITWGLLDKAQQYKWYSGHDFTPQVNLQDIATHGPSGVRLQMFKDNLVASLHDNQLLQSNTENSAFNFVHQHSIAQPFCEHSKHHLFTADLKNHFQDVLFPMAHTVHVSPVSAYCTAWAVEHALMLTLQKQLPSDHIALLEQIDLEQITRQRCYVQLEQIGICQLRGVFEMPPPEISSSITCPQMPTPHTSLNCACSWELPNNLIACQTSELGAVTFYDPAQCVGMSTCSSTDMELSFEPRMFATEDVQLRSMHWPQNIPAREAGVGTIEAMAERIAKIVAYKNVHPIDVNLLRDEIDAQLLAHDSVHVEGEAPDAFCDDLYDWYPSDAQHPVGYHPTSTMDHETTFVRGFDAWMSGFTQQHAEKFDYVIDPRMRNSTTSSRYFGAGNMVCDARIYGKILREPKSYFVETRWDAESGMDPATPGEAKAARQWSTIGINTMQSALHTPLLQAWEELIADFEEDYIQHQTGLVRNWLRCTASDGSQVDTSNTWPNWLPDERVGAYGFVAAGKDGSEQCSEHPVATCQTDADCTPGQDLVCLLVPDQDNTEFPQQQVGVCAKANTCFAHQHCTDIDPDTLCGGEGRCLQASIILSNHLGADIDMQLFSDVGDSENTQLPEGTAGFSEYEQISDFAHAQGLCSLFHWQTRYNKTQLAGQDFTQMLHLIDRDDDHTMLQKPHACDRTWQHTSLAAHALLEASFSSGADTQDKRVSYTRSWTDEDKRVECDFVQLRKPQGIIDPYSYFNASIQNQQDTLNFVHSTVQRCSSFDLCPVLQFQLDGGFTVPKRLSVGTTRSPSTRHIVLNPEQTIPHTSRTKANCGAAGQATAYGTCVLDQLVVPVAAVVYHMANLDFDSFDYAAPGHLLAPYLPVLSAAQQQSLQDSTRQHCPLATDDIWLTMYVQLMREYQYHDRQAVSMTASRLLPALFGVEFDDTNKMTNLQNNAWTIEEYLQHVQCAEWLFSMLEALRNNMPNVYQSDPRFEQKRPGTSLYVFHDRAHIELPFQWFWKCVLLNKYPQANWLQRLAGSNTAAAVDANSLQQTHIQTCALETIQEQQESITVRRRLQNAVHYFERDLVISAQAIDQLAMDVDATLARGLDELGLREFPDLFKLDVTSNCEIPLSSGFFPTKAEVDLDSSCVVKYGQGLTETLLTNDQVQKILSDPTANPLANSGLRVAARKHLFGFGSHSVLRTKTFADLAEFLSENNDIDNSYVAPDTSFIPRLKFKKNTPDSVHIIPFMETLSGSDEYQCFYTVDDTKIEYTKPASATVTTFELTHPEYMRYKPPAGHSVGDDNYMLYLREDEALHELLEWFFRDIYTTPTFRSKNLFASSKLIAGTGQAGSRDEIDFSLAYRFNAQLQERVFECSENNELDENAVTNAVHGQLRACLRSMQHNLGIRVPAGDTVSLPVSGKVMLQGFYPAFSEHSVANDPVKTRGFLEALTSPDIGKLQFNSFCFTDIRTNTHTNINPLWSGMFDLDSGCDIEQVGVGFNAFYRVRADLPQPPHCNLQQPVNFRGSGTLLGTEVPLCERMPVAQTFCSRRTGTLAGNEGGPVSDLLTHNEVQWVRGLYSNSIFRRRTRFLPNVDASTTALVYYRGDIGGHKIQFQITNTGQLLVECVHMRESPDISCRDWLHDIEQFWAAEHEPPWRTPRTQDTQPWMCPLQLVSAWSGHKTQYQPNIMRNRVRFAGITSPYDSVHPLVPNRRPLPQLRAARFMSETQMCLHARDNTSALQSCQGLTQLQHAIKVALLQPAVDASAYHTRLFYSTSSAGNTCSQMLDWPHQNYTLRDGLFVQSDYNFIDKCWVQDRLPPFQLKLTPVTTQSTSTLGSVQNGGPCHMGRLLRVDNSALPAHPTRAIQDCKRGSSSLQCRYLDSQTNVGGSENFAWLNSDATSLPNTKQRKCSTAYTTQGARGMGIKSGVLSTGLDQTDSVQTIHSTTSTAATSPTSQLLSVGIPTHVRTARVLAAHLRNILCQSPNTNAECLTRLESVVDIADWENIDSFLAAFLSNAQETPTNSGESSAQSTDISDENLWTRPWVFCENASFCAPNDASFENFITKEHWLDHTQRLQQCSTKMQQAPRTTQANVDFCLLTPQTTLLCEKLQEWKTRHKQILCLAGGVDECPVTAFFYNPTTYSLSNREFVHDTVSNFYRAIFPDECASNEADTSIAEQIAANDAIKQHCASSKISTLKMILIALRGIKGVIIELMYYLSSMVAEFVKMLSLFWLTLGANQNLVFEAGNRMLMYLGMFFATIADLTSQLMRVLFAIIFRDGLPALIVNFIQELCAFVNFLHVHIIGTSPTTGALCPVFNVLGNALLDLGSGINNVPFLSALAPVINNAGHLLHKALPCSEEALMECDFSDDDDDISNSTGALPVATRCSASYQSFFGDNTPLSCTRADTCHRGLLDTSLVACVLCPEAAPGYATFGCEPYTKMCTCQMQHLVQTPCVRNSDCLDAPNCRFIDRFAKAAFGAQPCSTCAHARVCYVPDAASSGFCACGLQPLTFSPCISKDLAQTVHVKSDATCLLTRQVQTNVAQYTAAFANLLTTPCAMVFPSSVQCQQITNSRGESSGYFAVAHQLIQGFGRRLLEFSTNNATDNFDNFTQISTLSRSALCRDAAQAVQSGAQFLQNVHAACEDACLRSVQTINLLNLSVHELSFCSIEDFWASMQENPFFPLIILTDQHALRIILTRHTHLRHVITYAHSLQTAIDAYAHDANLFAQAFASNLSHATDVDHVTNISTDIHNTHDRHLLQGDNIRNNRYDALDALSFVFDSLFQDVSALHDTYVNDLRAVTETYYPPLHDAEQNIWLSNWPPQFTGTQATQSCQPLKRVLELSLQASNATLRHFTTYPPQRPSDKLSDAWPTFAVPHSANAANSTTTQTVSDWLADTFSALINALLELVGLKQGDVRGWAYTLIQALPDWVRCDIDRLQTCSGWRARLPNALIVSAAFFIMWYALMFQFNLGLLATMSMPLFGLLLLYTAYGYSLLCVPLVPPCLLLDVYQSLDALLPLYIDLPEQIYTNASCAHTSSVNASCLISCKNAPWQYSSWQDPLAWILAELGVGFTDAVFTVLQYIPLYDTQSLRDAVSIKAGMHVQDDAGVLFVHRLCAFTSSYLLLPYVMLAAVVVFGGVAALVVASRLLMPAAILVSSIFIAAFTK